MKKIVSILAVAAALAGCTKSGAFDIGPISPEMDSGVYKDATPGGSDDQGQGREPGVPGVITAGEWNDLDNWAFWSHLMTTKSDEQTTGYSDTPEYWRFWTDRRVAVSVKSAEGNPLPGVKVSLSDGGKEIWSAVTDVLGRADCWVGLHDPSSQQGTLSISLNGTAMSGSPAVTTWQDEELAMNEYTFSASAPQNSADILFIVDATGSMSDELEFLKADLLNILQRAQKTELPISIRTGALFYRDEDDDYLTRESPFTTDFTKTINFIKKQYADGGGDWPEAVHTALNKSLQSFDWNTSARARLAFILLDAPPHQDQQGVVESVNKSIDKYASMGIKLIPVASSGIDKPTEFLLRMMAIVTEGTYVFITDDSGIGNDHIEPTVGEFKVELLNDLMVRLIQKYLE